MPITEIQHATRAGFIGASDVPALFGIDLFKSPLDIYNDKVDPKPQDPIKVDSAIWYGNMLEPAILNMAWEKLGLPEDDKTGFETQTRFEHPCGWLACHVDAIFPGYNFRGKWIEGPIVVEAKSQGFTGRPPDDDWGRAGSDKVTDKVMIQVQTQLLCSQLANAVVPRLTGHKGSGLQVYYIKASSKLQKLIFDKCESFWNNHVIPRVPPQ